MESCWENVRRAVDEAFRVLRRFQKGGSKVLWEVMNVYVHNVPTELMIFGRGGGIRTRDPLRPREKNRFQRLHCLHLTSNIYNNLGNLLFRSS